MGREGDIVLVTGAGGFIAAHCIVQLLAGGYQVRGTVRNLSRAAQITQSVTQHVPGSADRFSLVATTLDDDAGWDQAMNGCSWVLHVASPVPHQAPKHPDDLIIPARDGTLRVLQAAAKAGVKRVVMTSSISAVVYGHKRDGSETYNEDDWTILSPNVTAYDQSKTIAEHAAWDYVNSLPADQRFELVTLLPGLVLGPVLGESASVSGEVVRKLLNREFPGCPDIGWAPVDVRDVAAAHVTAMTLPQAAGQRFILANAHVPMRQMAKVLAQHFDPQGFKVPTRPLPNWMLKLVALTDKTAALVVAELGKRQDLSSERAHTVLNWQTRDLETTLVEMGESMVTLGIVINPTQRRKAA